MAITQLDFPSTYYVMEHFYTIQGEGYHQGKAAYFIRLGGCNVGCVWCDVKDSWKRENHNIIPVQKLVDSVRESKAPIVVITGGEPSEYDLTHLTGEIRKAGIHTHLETAGTNPITGNWNWICLSPKKFKPVYDANYALADELKIIVYNKSDLKFAEAEAQKVRPDCKLFVQPEWSKEKLLLPMLIDFVKTNPRWMISLQMHKYINVP